MTLLDIVSEHVESATWEPMAVDTFAVHDPTAKAFRGVSHDFAWTLLVVSFAVPDLPGGRGFDGTATCASRSVVMHLSPDLAERCVALAEAS